MTDKIIGSVKFHEQWNKRYDVHNIDTKEKLGEVLLRHEEWKFHLNEDVALLVYESKAIKTFVDSLNEELEAEREEERRRRRRREEEEERRRRRNDDDFVTGFAAASIIGSSFRSFGGGGFGGGGGSF